MYLLDRLTGEPGFILGMQKSQLLRNTHTHTYTHTHTHAHTLSCPSSPVRTEQADTPLVGQWYVFCCSSSFCAVYGSTCTFLVEKAPVPLLVVYMVECALTPIHFFYFPAISQLLYVLSSQCSCLNLHKVRKWSLPLHIHTLVSTSIQEVLF